MVTGYLEPRLHEPGCAVVEERVAVSRSGRWLIARCAGCGAVRLVEVGVSS